MVGCWAVWERRNKWVFEDEHRGIGEVVRRTVDMCKEIEEGENGGGKGLTAEGDKEGRGKGWTKPGGGVAKINVDAFVKEGVGTGLGAVCRDVRGEVNWLVVDQRRWDMEPKEAEAEALLLGVKEAARRSIRDIIMKSDCQVLIKALRTREHGRSDYYLILDDILFACNSFNSVQWSFVGRESNKVAHEIARLAPWTVGKREWSNGFPDNIMAHVSDDLLMKV
ncbi:uncharacterized protein LOC141649305 [Silene latifolia]|uniref:uncharacterized protein LOC141649305 n=1 Tax=Silene latifolia TaxID=37657 RepID=UPI003D773BE5